MVACMRPEPDGANLEIRHSLVVVALDNLKFFARHGCGRQLVAASTKHAVWKFAVIGSSLFAEVDGGTADEEFERQLAACLGIGAALDAAISVSARSISSRSEAYLKLVVLRGVDELFAQGNR